MAKSDNESDKMQFLPNNCRMGKIHVHPANWKTVRANVKAKWYIKYVFYDDNLKQQKQVTIKGMNDCTNLKRKQQVTEDLINAEINVLQHGFNRITKQFSLTHETEITEHTPFSEALQYAFTRIKVAANFLPVVKSHLKFIIEAAVAKQYDRIPISEIKRRHIVLLFEQLEKTKKKWSEHAFNSYRITMGMLYKELVKLDIVTANLGYALERLTPPEKVRETLTAKQRKQVDEYLFNNHYTFWRLVHIFFHAGCREIEILNVRKEDVSLSAQRFKVLVKKGKKGTREEWRTIKNIALPLWTEIMQQANDKQYLFSKGLQPGDNKIRTEQIARYWLRHVKNQFGITADFYSLKHSNLDEIAKAKGIKAAQEAAGHASAKMTKVYAFGEELREQQREHEFTKTADNKFA